MGPWRRLSGQHGWLTSDWFESWQLQFAQSYNNCYKNTRSLLDNDVVSPAISNLLRNNTLISLKKFFLALYSFELMRPNTLNYLFTGSHVQIEKNH